MLNRAFANTRWSKKHAAVGIIIVVCLMFAIYKLMPHKPVSPPRTVVAKALEATAQADSYYYHIKMETVVNGKEGVYTDVEGWREGKNKIHIKGKIIDSDIDFYQIEDTTYTKDQLAGKWIKIVDNQLNQDEIFAAELNPLANLQYKELDEVSYEGIVEEQEKKVWKYHIKPLVDNPYLEILWNDFGYDFWIDREEGVLVKAVVTARNKTVPKDKLIITMIFSQYGEDFSIKPPM